MSRLPIATIGRRVVSITARMLRADKAGDDLPLLHRLAIIYLMIPVVIWLIGWFHWWFGILAAVLIVLALRPALSGPVRLSPPRPLTLAVLLVACAWVMSTAAGGVFDFSNPDWPKHRSILLNLGYYPWPTFLPDPLSAYLPGEFSPPYLLRYYLGWYMVPGLFAQLLGLGALNYAVPIWTWLGVALIMLLFIRQRGGWGVVVAILVFVFFGGLDSLQAILFRTVGESTEPIQSTVQVQYLTNIRSLSWTPQHFIPAGLYTLLLLQLHRHFRFLGVSPILLAAAPFWSSLVAIGLLPFIATILWKHGLRPFLRWSSLPLATALAGLIAFYLTSGPLDLERGWIWARNDWTILARWIPTFYLTEFLLLALLLCAVRPSLLNRPFFLVGLASLVLVPLYHYGYHNDLASQASTPALLVLCYYSADTICEHAPAVFRGAAAWWKRLVLACIAVTLSIGSLATISELERAFSGVDIFRYDQVDYAVTLDVPMHAMDQYIAHDRSNPALPVTRQR